MKTWKCGNCGLSFSLSAALSVIADVAWCPFCGECLDDDWGGNDEDEEDDDA